jgi:hypothetical protein
MTEPVEERREAPEKPKWWAPDFSHRLEAGGKAAAGVLGAVGASTFLFYLLGFVIVNLYLLSAGARDIELSKPAYLPAGIAFAVVLVTAVGGIYLLFSFLADGVAGWPRRIAVAGAALLLHLCLSFLFLVILYEEPLTQSAEQACSYHLGDSFLGRLGAYGGFLIGLGILETLLLVVLVARPSGGRVLPRRTETVLLTCLPFVGLLLLVTWGTDVYPTMNPALGGGRPTMIRLGVPEAHAREGLEALGLPFDDQVSQPAGLVDQTEENLLLILLGDDGNHDKVLVPQASVETLQFLSGETQLELKLLNLLEKKLGRPLEPETESRVRRLAGREALCCVVKCAADSKSIEKVRLDYCLGKPCS